MMLQKPYDLKKRTFQFSKRILEIADLLPKNRICDVLTYQLVKSGTSIGANVEEADGTITRPDLRNRMVIARKEAKETEYWLRLISSKYIRQNLIQTDITEAHEITKILSTIINKLR